MIKADVDNLQAPPAGCCELPEVHFHDEEQVAKSVAIFKALADPTRLRIMKALAETGELCECNIVPGFGLTQPTISYHLKVLREAGLVLSERRGQWVYHQANQKAMLNTIRSLAELS